MDRLAELLGRRRVVLGDGAMGTMLHRAGLTIGAPEQWNVKRPEVVAQIHRGYVEAGSVSCVRNAETLTRKVGAAGRRWRVARRCRHNQ